MTEQDSKFMAHAAPLPGVKYPLKIVYCPFEICDGWPLEYCEYHPGYEKAKKWAEENISDDIRDIFLDNDEENEDGDGEKKKRQTRGGRGVVKTKQKQEVEKKICLSRACRGKKKYVTVVTGLSTYEIDLKTASKYFGSRFACGSSITNDDEIVIQGDVKDDLYDVLVDKWPQIDGETIEDMGDQKR